MSSLHPHALAAPRGLSDTQLKLIALFLMVLDHIHYFFGFTGLVPDAFSMLGRLSAPLFLFCTVEGFAHTHDRRRYFKRIWVISAGMGLILFLMMYARIGVRPDGFYPMNAIFMNFVILIPVWQGIDWLRQRRIGRGLAAVLLPLAWPLLFVVLYQLSQAGPAAWATDSLLALLVYTVLPAWSFISDGGIFFILTGIGMYLTREHRALQAAVFAGMTLLFDFVLVAAMLYKGEGFSLSLMFTDYYEWFGVFAVLPMLMYNGSRGRGFPWLFYCFFPAQIYILSALSWAACLALT